MQQFDFKQCPTVCILMSTYNGERFLKAQVDSLEKQDYSKISILVRDDGSKDATRLLLAEYSQQKRLCWYEGKNLGPAQSFLELLRNSPEADYYAFSDQDDVWLPDKVSSAIGMLEALPQSIKLYFSATTPVDVELKPMRHSSNIDIRTTLDDVIFYNCASGCTMMISRALRDVINEYCPSKILMHDWWIYLVCLALEGGVVYDNVSHILYRQHDSNVISAKEHFGAMLRRFLSPKQPDIRRSDHVRELLKGYSSKMDQKKVLQLEALANYDRNVWSRLKFAVGCKYRSSSVSKNLRYRISALRKRM